MTWFPSQGHWEMLPDPFALAPIARHIWATKYRLVDEGGRGDENLEATWHRVAKALAAAEGSGSRESWATRFEAAMADFAFLPAGRIIAGAGSGRQVTLFNCFVMGEIGDDLGSIFDNVKEAALTMQQGGGIGHDFSTLRPRGAPVSTLGADASGPVSFMDVWDAMCRTIMSAGARRGAMMGTLRCDHPDIELFVAAKEDAARLRNFNLSVLVTDAFIESVRSDAPWDLVFGGRRYRTVQARALWDRIMQSTYDYAEPGVIFIDRINAANNLAYCEAIGATNPCGEQPLPPYGACLLGSINLARLVHRPFAEDAHIDTGTLESLVETAVRMLDNAIDVSNYPLAAQRKEGFAKRRIGLGITGLADALAMCGARYGAPEAARLAGSWMQTVQNAAYLASSRLSKEKGAFPLCDTERLLASPNIVRLEAETRAAISRDGLRNGCLTSIAPTGTISLLAGNVSSGIEPIFDLRYDRRVLEPDGSSRTEAVEDYAVALYRTQAEGQGTVAAELPEAFVTAQDLTVAAHIEMQAAVQPWVDSSISKTINCPADMPFEAFKDVYLLAYDRGLKGCTTYRPNPVTGSVLSRSSAAATADRPDPPNSGSLSGKALVRGQDAGVKTSTVMPPAPRQEGAVVFMTEPLERAKTLAGFTYKLKWPGSADALYVTINDMERDGRRVPFEIFINTKNLDHYAWTVALTRMISAVFRRGGDVSFVVEELKAIFDPQGGRWLDGRYVPSLLAAIGEVIEAHMVSIGFLPSDTQERQHALRRAGAPSVRNAADPRGTSSGFEPMSDMRSGRACPQCGHRGMRLAEGCWICPACGYSQCG